MPLTAAQLAPGILPDAVIRDTTADAYLIGVTLQPQLGAAEIQSWLQTVTGLIEQLEASSDGQPRRATVCVAVGASFFLAGGNSRFGLPADSIPLELANPPELPTLATITSAGADVLFYIMATSATVVAEFERGLAQTHSTAIASTWTESGFQRSDRRELFGYRDGLRNVPADERESVVFLDGDEPEEPAWTEGGSYMAYVKVSQNLDAMAGKAEAEQNQIIGRRKTDGSRLDLPEGTAIAQEGEFAEGNACPASAHVRKVGPRGALHDAIKIFRRGVPYLTLNPDGSADGGLQFVSFQRSLENFDVIFTRWMTNPNFPAPGTGPDALLAQNLITFEKYGLFFAPPRDARYIGASIFDPPTPDPCATGIVVVKKRLVDQNNQPVLAELGGIGFEIRDTSGNVVGAEFKTDSSGRAASPPVPRGTQLVVHEMSAPPGFLQAEDTTVTVAKARQRVIVTNREAPEGNPVYSG
jgi:deferrochelatase/peroxidase EfeB